MRTSDEQSAKMDSWLDMLRASYNYNLRDRIDTYYSRFVFGDYCDLVTFAEICPLTCLVGSASGYPWKISGAAKVKKLEDNGIFGDYCELESQKLVKQDQIKPKLR
ncbi:MAG: hypothetical protein DSM106950_38185, partial [Stigonema ocellatum SAG 48.90 = DSM 106950]|nr:hypothetical protein [Stigonema ocellatum SAG 48.90 = DSM 106950]